MKMKKGSFTKAVTKQMETKAEATAGAEEVVERDGLQVLVTQLPSGKWQGFARKRSANKSVWQGGELVDIQKSNSLQVPGVFFDEDMDQRGQNYGNSFASKGKEDWENFYPRAPKGTKARIVKACNGGKIADWLTAAILEKLEREGF